MSGANLVKKVTEIAFWRMKSMPKEVSAQKTQSVNKIKYRKDYQPTAYGIDQTELIFELENEATQVTAILHFVARENKNNEPLVLHGKQLELIHLQLDGRELTEDEFCYEHDRLTVFHVPQKPFVLTSKVKINPQANTSLNGLYLSNGKFCTQCEAEGFRGITFYLDRPDVLSVFTTTIFADKNRFPILLSNGNPIEEIEIDHHRKKIVWHDPFPKPSYLFALVAGDFDCLEDHFITRSHRKIKLQIFVDKGKLEQTHHAMASLKKAMAWDGERFGREYDLDIYMIVAISDFNMGAMENKGLNVFNTKYVLADAHTATDNDFLGVESVIAHEYFHNWTGNRITCRDWFQLSLKEGLTVFRDQEFSSDMNSRAVKRIEDVQIIKSVQFAEDAGPMSHPIRPESYIEMNNFYTVTVYNKGAEVIRMMQTLLGRSGFRKGMDCYFQRHDGQAVTCEDFIKAMEDATDRDLTQFRNWYRQSGTPEVTVDSENYDTDKKCFLLELSQQCLPTADQQKKKCFHIPLKAGFVDEEGNDVEVVYQNKKASEFVLDLKQPEQQFIFEQVNKPVTLSLLRDFSAPVKLHRKINNKKLAFLFANDSNEYARWDAGQTLMSRAVFALYNGDEKTQLENDLILAMKKLLTNPVDTSFTALSLKVPSVSTLEAEAENIDILLLHQSRKKLIKIIASRLLNLFEEVFHNCRDNLAENNPDCDQSAAIGLRSLATMALLYMHEAKVSEAEKKAEQIAITIFNNPRNMTEELATFQLLIDSDKVDKVSELFYERWKNDDLVLDKWFASLANNGDELAFDRVKKLWHHPDMVHTNPNKVRSLLASFAANVAAFHQVDGSGYDWYAERILEMDSINPQISARLVSVFNRWKKYDKERQIKMNKALEKIQHKKDLSRDVSEIVEKALAMG